ncbi:MAG TPA: PHB depolymerase family esterase [Longimicrobium sp.]|jgi:poly(hydroxyalkanoate) depolymerase family esterase
MTTAPLLAMTAASMLAAAPADTSGSWEWHTHTSDAGTRRYRLFVPAGVDASRPAPLVVMLHGCTQDPDDFARGTRFNEAAAEERVIVAYPEQTGALHPQKCWTWYDPAHQARGGEPALVAGIAREVMAARPVDAKRVYVAGISAGAAMAINTAAAYPELFAAAGAHSGIAYRAATAVPQALAVMRNGSAAPDSLRVERAVPLIVFHGASDPVVAPINGRQLAALWARAGGLKDFQRSEMETGGLRATRDVYGPFLELWMVEGLGHAWSGGSAEGTYTDVRGPDATREMLRFFLAHTR